MLKHTKSLNNTDDVVINRHIWTAKFYGICFTNILCTFFKTMSIPELSEASNFNKNSISVLNLMGGRGLELVYIVLYLFYLHLIGTVFSLMSRYDNKYFINTLQACNVASQRVMGKGFTLISFVHNMITYLRKCHIRYVQYLCWEPPYKIVSITSNVNSGL
jgi:hypothetical protein